MTTIAAGPSGIGPRPRVLPQRSSSIPSCAPSPRLALVKQGLRVLATARRVETISGLLPLGIETHSPEADKPECVSTVKKQVEELTGGRLDILANNAGRNSTVPALDVDFGEVRSTFEVNVFAVMRMCQEFAPLLIEVNSLLQGCVLSRT